MPDSIRVLAMGKYLPEKVVKNEDFTAFIDTSDEWIQTRTGMQQRYVAVDEPTWYMGAKAAEQAIANAGIDPQSIDFILFTTVTPDFYTPSCACMVQHHLGIANAAAVDINVACTAFAFGLDMARQYLAGGDYRRVLIVSAESLSQLANYEDRGTCVLFGDAASACIVEQAEGVYGALQRADISGTEHLYAAIPRMATPFGTPQKKAEYTPFPIELNNLLFMNGKEVYKFAIQAIPLAVEEACKKAGVAVTDLQMIIPHQANIRIIETAAKNLHLPIERFYVNIHKYGNTSSASTSLALGEAVAEGVITRGDTICVVGFGAGLTYGAVVFTY